MAQMDLRKTQQRLKLLALVRGTDWRSRYCPIYVFVVFLIFITLYYFVFFFSSRRRHTICLSDWCSDVCSSDREPRLPLREAESPGRNCFLRWTEDGPLLP